MQETNFRIFSGHALSQVGSSAGALKCLQKIFKRATHEDDYSAVDIMNDGALSPLSPGSPITSDRAVSHRSPRSTHQSTARLSATSARRNSSARPSATTPTSAAAAAGNAASLSPHSVGGTARVAQQLREAGLSAQERVHSPRNSSVSGISPRSSSAAPPQHRDSTTTPTSARGNRSLSVGSKQRNTQFSFRSVAHQQSSVSIASDVDASTIASAVSPEPSTLRRASTANSRRRSSLRAPAPPLPDGNPPLNTSRRIPPSLAANASRTSLVSPSQRSQARPPSSRRSDRSSRASVVSDVSEDQEQGPVESSRDYKFFIAVSTKGAKQVPAVA